MTGGAPGTQQDPTNILDAVCVVYFAASGQIGLLCDILDKATYRIYLPEEVLDEVRRKAKRKRWNIRGLEGCLQVGRPAGGRPPVAQVSRYSSSPGSPPPRWRSLRCSAKSADDTRKPWLQCRRRIEILTGMKTSASVSW